MPDADRQQIAKSLRFIDEARRALEAQQNPDNGSHDPANRFLFAQLRFHCLRCGVSHNSFDCFDFTYINMAHKPVR